MVYFKITNIEAKIAWDQDMKTFLKRQKLACLPICV
jgi:hypothetical protein